MFAFCRKSFREELCLRGEHLDLKHSPSHKSCPFPNETPDLEATGPGARSKREASGPAPGGQSRDPAPERAPGRTSPGTGRGFVPTWEGLGGGRGQDAGAEVGRNVGVRDGAWRRRRRLGSRRPPAPRPVCGSEERLPPGEEETARGLAGVHTRARGGGPLSPHNSRGPGSFLHTHTLVYSVLLHLSGR